MNENEKDYLKEKIKMRTELFRFLLVFAFGTISGVLSVIYDNKESFGKIFAAGFFGLIAVVLQVIAIYYFWADTNKIIEKLKQ